MSVFSCVRNWFLSTKRKFQTNNLESLLWLVNIVPSIAGFSIRSERIKAPFFIVHYFLLFYVYAVGLFVYQWKYGEGAEDLIKSYLSLSILILVLNNTNWWSQQRTLLRAILKDIEKSDRMSRRSPSLETRHGKLMRIIKWIMLVFYGTNYCNGLLVYWPNRMDLGSKYSMTPCVGLEPLTRSPNREICKVMLYTQEVAIATVVLNFQVLLMLLIAHTSAMYQLLAQEMMMFNENENIPDVKALAKELLPTLVYRHSLTLEVVDKLRSLYSVPLGVNFGTNAVCMCLFCYLPLQEWLKFMPILVYSFLLYFLYCYLGQRLINASEEFETAVYCCGWENFDLKEKKIIYVMLRQAQKPIQLLAADIIPVNIYTFATTLQGLYKFVTVVKF